MTCPDCGWYCERYADMIMISDLWRGSMADDYDPAGFSIDGAHWSAYCPRCGNFLCDAMSVVR